MTFPAGWQEITGDSYVLGGELVIPTGGKVLCTTPHPVANTATCNVTVRLTTLDEGSVYQVRVNAESDGSGGELVEFEITADSSFLRTDTEELETGDASGWGGEALLILCRNLEGIYAQVYQSIVGIEYECLGTDYGGRYVTLANGGGDTTWDDFEYEQHYITDPDCPACPCDCDHHCMPKELTLTISVVGGTPPLCDCVDGFNCTLTQKEGGGFPFGHSGHFAWEWEGTRLLWDCNHAPTLYYWKYRLECDHAGGCPGDAPSWTLTGCAETQLVEQCGLGGGDYDWKAASAEGGYDCNIACPVEVICHPFYLKYGEPFECELLIAGPILAFCEYYIEITE